MKKQNSLQESILSLARLHFLLAGLFVFVTVISDAWNLIPPEVVLQRWTLIALLTAVNAVIWYVARATRAQMVQYAYVWLIALTDIAVATVLVFAQRGMASKAVALYVIPLIVVAVLRSRAALITAAALSFASYSLAIMRYFVTSPGEGYKVELYTEMFMYGGLFFLVAMFLYSLVRKR